MGQALEQVPSLQANTLASTLFLNRGLRFEAVPLPPTAQWAPAFGISIADFDGDGQEDAFLSQNCFAMRAEEPRLDSGRGLLLRGRGNGSLEPVPGQLSGLAIYGEQRGCAAADFDGDGRVDLAVSQRGGATQLYGNRGGQAGLRVRLRGRGANPDGIGAQLRLLFEGRAGPVREVHGGGGYWSQDSVVQVLATPTEPSAIWVRWPGGKTLTQAVPPGTREIVVQEQ